jgi:CheY-like chemotaxis protein
VTPVAENRSARILVADDERLVCNLIGRIAAEYTEDVTLAGGGQEALNALEHNDFDLVITDIRMPSIDGLAVVQWITNRRPSTKIIAMTGFASGDTEDAVAALGADLLHKPFGAHELRLAIARALGLEAPSQ